MIASIGSMAPKNIVSGFIEYDFISSTTASGQADTITQTVTFPSPMSFPKKYGIMVLDVKSSSQASSAGPFLGLNSQFLTMNGSLILNQNRSGTVAISATSVSETSTSLTVAVTLAANKNKCIASVIYYIIGGE